MRCIIIDDEEMSREVLSTMIYKSPKLLLIQQFSNAIDAIKFLNEDNRVDLIFLDIHMPNFSGFDLVKTIKNLPPVIFVTTDENFALDAFNYDCITDYLVKPINFDRFEKAVDRVEIRRGKHLIPIMANSDLSTKEIYINIDKRLIKIDLGSIKLIQANGDYINIKTDTINYTVHTTLKKIEEKLSNSIFLKIHRSYIINLNKIVDIQDSTVLIGKDVVPISKNNRAVLMNSLNLI